MPVFSLRALPLFSPALQRLTLRPHFPYSTATLVLDVVRQQYHSRNCQCSRKTKARLFILLLFLSFLFPFLLLAISLIYSSNCYQIGLVRCYIFWVKWTLHSSSLAPSFCLSGLGFLVTFCWSSSMETLLSPFLVSYVSYHPCGQVPKLKTPMF